jgi:transcriptional regulator GlxA family with amidase domain
MRGRRVLAARQGEAQGRSVAPRQSEVVFLLHDGFEVIDLAGPASVFGGARDLEGRSAYDLRVVSRLGQPVRSGEGLTISVDGPAHAVTGPVDTFVVPGGLQVAQAARDAALLHEVRRLAARSRRVVSVCSGALLLAAAGLLDGRRATTHWAATGQLAARHPRVDVAGSVVWVRDGDVYTSAGATTGIDLALALVEEDLGAAAAARLARWMVVFARRPGTQPQASVRSSLPPPRTALLHRALDVVVEDPTADLSVRALAARSSMSPRHFARVFTREMGTTPGRYVERIRVEAAQHLLGSSTAGLEVVAASSGFANVETMRRAFHRVLGVPPGRYRSGLAPARTTTTGFAPA